MRFFITFIFITNILFSFEYTNDVFKKEKATILKVVDGDTVKVVMNKKVYKVRFAYVDTMETKRNRKAKKDFKNTKDSVDIKEIIEYGYKAKAFLKKELPSYSIVVLYINKNKPKDSFGRILAVIKKEKNNTVINEVLLALGLARTYYIHEAPEDVKEYYLEIEKMAKNENRGIWKFLKK